MKRFKILAFMLSGFIIVVLTSCGGGGGGGDNTSNSDTDISTNKGGGSNNSSNIDKKIGSNGGKISQENAYVEVPAGAFSNEYDMTMTVSQNATFDKNNVPEEYIIEGLNDKDFSKPIMLAVKQEEEDNDLLLLKIDTFIKSQNTTVTKYRIVEGEVKDGYITYKFYPNTTEVSDISQINPKYFKSIGDYFDIGWAAIKGYKILDTERGHFRIFFPTVYINEVLDLEDYLEDAYDYYTDMGFDLTKRKSWPMEINIIPFGEKHKYAYGFYNQSKRGVVSDNYGYIDFNTRMIDKDINALKTTVIHEFFHFAQSLYYPTTLGFKHGNASTWFDEACAVWAEGDYISGYISKMRDNNVNYLPFGGFVNTQDYGYGMSALVKKMVDLYGKDTLSDIYKNYLSGSFNITHYVNKSFQDLFFWDNFIEEYLENKIYGNLEINKLVPPNKKHILEKAFFYTRDITLSDWQTNFSYFPFPKDFSTNIDIKTGMTIDITGDTSDVTAIAFNLDKNSKSLIKIETKGKSIKIKDIDALFKKGSYGIFVAVTNRHIEAPFDKNKKIKLKIKVLNIADSCPLTYDVSKINHIHNEFYIENEAMNGKGFICDYYDSNKLEISTPIIKVYKNNSNIADGIAKIYYETGKLKGEIPYKKDVIDGISKYYYENGKLSAEIPFRKGVKDGIKKKYYKTGHLSSEIPYKNNILDGIAKDYYETGELASETSWKKGILEGIAKDYYENGKLSAETPFRKGVKDGISKSYYENGKLAYETPYKQGLKDGIEKEYDENGKLIISRKYKNDKMINCTQYLDDGSTRSCM